MDVETTTFNGNEEDKYSSNGNEKYDSQSKGGGESLYGAVSSLLSSMFYPDPESPSSFFQRTKGSLREYLPRIGEASRTTACDILGWARQGSYLRLVLVISVGTITVVTLTGVIVFFVLMAAATVNTMILSLFVSLAAAGGFLAIFFACVAGIYIATVSVAFFVISAATISAVITILVVTGWIGFFWIVWLIARKSASFAKHSLTITGSALTAYTSGWHGHRRHHHDD